MPLPMPIYRFADYRFDSDKLHLTCDGKAVSAQPRVLELLAFLIERRDRVVLRDEMADALWDRQVVSEDAITKRIGLLRKVLDDTSAERRFIQTAYGKGARFVANVYLAAPAAQAVASSPPETASTPVSPPSIVILPFRTVGTLGAHSSIATGLPDDITSALVKLRSIRVIARGTAFRYAAGDTPLADLRRDLGVTHALGGSVETVPQGVQIYVELLRTADEGIVWSESLRIAAEEIHEVRDELVNRLVNRAEIAIPRDEAARAALKMPSQLSAWEAYHRALSLGVETLRPDYPRARVYLARTIAAAPDFSRAHAALAFVHWNSFNEGDLGEDHRAAMLAAAERAVELDPDDPMARVAYGTMLGSTGDMKTGAAQVEQALLLAPGMARSHAAISGFLTARGELGQSLSAIDQAISLSPRDPHLARWLSIRLVDHMLLGRTDDARHDAYEIERIGSDQVSALGWALTGFAVAGDRDGAARTKARLVRLLPNGKAQDIPPSYKSLPPMLQALLTKTLRDHDLMS